VDQPTRGCFEVNGTKEGPVSAQSVIPDVSVFKKVEGSKTQIRGQECELWQNVTELYGRTNTYNLWLARRNTNARPYYPVRYEMKGFNSLLGSHYDHYIIDYDVFEAATPDKDVFDVPSNLTCTGFPGPGQRGERASFNPIGEFISGVDHRCVSGTKTLTMDTTMKGFLPSYGEIIVSLDSYWESSVEIIGVYPFESLN
jgi:hypothetical protein